MSYLKRFGTRRVPQTAPIPGSGQARNSAGGYAWAVDDWMRLRRFLILGTEGGCYYASRADAHAKERRRGRRCLARGRPAGGRRDRRGSATRAGRRRTTRRCSRSRWRRARRRGDAQGRARRAAAGVPHRHAPVPLRDVRRGLPRLGPLAASRGRRLVRGQPPDALAYQAVKYRQREGVTHRDLLRLAHPAKRVGAGNPRSRSRASTLASSSGSSAAARRTACRG